MSASRVYRAPTIASRPSLIPEYVPISTVTVSMYTVQYEFHHCRLVCRTEGELSAGAGACYRSMVTSSDTSEPDAKTAKIEDTMTRWVWPRRFSPQVMMRILSPSIHSGHLTNHGPCTVAETEALSD